MVLRCALLLVALAAVVGTSDADIHTALTDARTASKAETDAPRAPVKPPEAGMADAAVEAVDEWARQRPDTELEIAVLDRSTGELAENTEATPLYSASVVKVILAVDMLQRGHNGVPVGEEDVQLLRSALSVSDDAAMNTLWDRFDGSGAISRVAGQLGLTDTHAPEDSMWGDTEISAKDMVLVFNHVLAMPPEDRALITGSLSGPPAPAKDGFDQAYGLAAPQYANRALAVKPGWMCCHSGERTLHSVGVVGPSERYVVALLSMHPSSRGYDGSRDVLTEVAGTVLRPLR